MSATGRYIKYTEILRSVYRDFEFNYELQHVDALEWIGSLMRLLNVQNSLVDKLTDNNSDLNHQDFILIEDFRGKLPCDLHSILGCATFLGTDKDRVCRGSLIPMHYATDLMHKYTKTQCCDFPNTDTANVPSAVRTDISSLITTRFPVRNVEPGLLTYKVNDNHIFTNFCSGFVVMAYKAVPLDEQGFPLIPYEEAFRKAAIFEVGSKIATKLWLRGDMTSDKVQWFWRERNWYVAAASNGASMPSLDEWEDIKVDRLRLIPKVDQHRSFFAHLQVPEKIYSNPIQFNYNG